jgi:hypothetical protein
MSLPLPGIIKEGELAYVKNAVLFSYWSTTYAQLLRRDHSLFLFADANAAARGDYHTQVEIPETPGSTGLLVEAEQRQDEKRPFVFTITVDGVQQLFATQTAADLAEWIDALANFNTHRQHEASVRALSAARQVVISNLRAGNQPPALLLSDRSQFQRVPKPKFSESTHPCDSAWPAPLAPLSPARFTYSLAPLFAVLANVMPWALPAGAVTAGNVIDKIARRAHSCGIAAVLGGTVHGITGGDGTRGVNGSRGAEGLTISTPGHKGTDGGPGGPATNGTPGLNGTPGIGRLVVQSHSRRLRARHRLAAHGGLVYGRVQARSARRAAHRRQGRRRWRGRRRWPRRQRWPRRPPVAAARKVRAVTIPTPEAGMAVPVAAAATVATADLAGRLAVERVAATVLLPAAVAT